MTSSIDSSRPRLPRRWPLVILLLASLCWIGLVVGSAVGASRVPEGSGLAGPAIALGYGVLGVGVGLVLGGLLGWRASHGLLQLATAISVVVGIAAEMRAARDHFTSLCGVPGSATHIYTFEESAPHRSSWAIAADFQCLQQNPELGELDWILGRIPIAAVSHGRAECSG